MMHTNGSFPVSILHCWGKMSPLEEVGKDRCAHYSSPCLARSSSGTGVCFGLQLRGIESSMAEKVQ